jgi:orotate phosphoribosyltransferase
VTPASVLDLFRSHGALLDGHFKLSSGLHSPAYLQSALVLQFPDAAASLGQALAEQLRVMSPTVVLSPALGGIVIGHEVARALGVRALFAERVEGRLMLRRGFALRSADRVAVVEDVLTTGKSTLETIDVAAGAGVSVVAAGAIIDRSPHAVDLGVPFVALARVDVSSVPPETCPLCAAGMPAVKPGSRPG